MAEYADRDVIALGEHYTRHLSAMTEEDLSSKAGIAAELAWRDMQIYDLSCKVYYRDERVAELETQLEALSLLLISRDMCLEEVKEAIAEDQLVTSGLPEQFHPAIAAYKARLALEQNKSLEIVERLQRQLDAE